MQKNTILSNNNKSNYSIQSTFLQSFFKKKVSLPVFTTPLYGFFFVYQECGGTLLFNRASGVIVNGAMVRYPFLRYSYLICLVRE